MADTVVEKSVRARYAAAAGKVEAALCCPSIEYNRTHLTNVPAEVIEVDYGCGDPTPWIEAGETILDLGSGSGKVCYLASQVVGPTGSVIGVDFNEPMLALARSCQPEFARRVGFDNIRFVKGRIQDLALDLDRLDAWLKSHPVRKADDYLAMQEQIAGLRAAHPLIPDESIDCIVSNCVLNLVEPLMKEKLFTGMFRALKRGGRCVISDIVSDEDVPDSMQADGELWSGCISGAFRQDRFIEAFERAGYYGVEILRRSAEPWRVVKGIEFRSVTVRAYKGKQGPCMERNQAVVYRGPWKKVTDDDGHTLHRGVPMAVCDKTYQLYMREPYAAGIIPVAPRDDVPLDSAVPFDCRGSARRDPKVTKGVGYDETTAVQDDCCGSDGCC